MQVKKPPFLPCTRENLSPFWGKNGSLRGPLRPIGRPPSARNRKLLIPVGFPTHFLGRSQKAHPVSTCEKTFSICFCPFRQKADVHQIYNSCVHECFPIPHDILLPGTKPRVSRVATKVTWGRQGGGHGVLKRKWGFTKKGESHSVSQRRRADEWVP